MHHLSTNGNTAAAWEKDALGKSHVRVDKEGRSPITTVKFFSTSVQTHNLGAGKEGMLC
jgi:hypothetical protein